MRNKALAVGRKIDDFIAQQIRFNAGDANSVQSFNRIQLMQQINEPVLVALVAKFSLSVIANVNAGQDDFLDALLHQMLRLLDHLLQTSRTTHPTRHGNGAVGAGIVATVLYFEESPSPIAQAVCRFVAVDLLDFAGVDDGFVILLSVGQKLTQMQFFPCTYDEIHAFHSGNFRGAKLRIAAGDHDKTLWVGSQGLAHHAAAFRIRLLGDRAGVDDDHIGACFQVYHGHSGRLKIPGNRA